MSSHAWVTARPSFARRAPDETSFGNASVRRPSLRGLRVLVVDDDADARELLAMILEEEGCVVCSAESAREAMRCIGTFMPDVLLSDIAMPEEDGYALIRNVRGLSRERGGEMPAAAITAYSRPEDRKKVLQSGFSLHVAKPIDPSQLLAALITLAAMVPPRPLPS